MTTKLTGEEPVYKREAGTLEHFIGCPAEHIEMFEAKGPNKGKLGEGWVGGTFRVTRCLDCGVQIEAIVSKASA